MKFSYGGEPYFGGTSQGAFLLLGRDYAAALGPAWRGGPRGGGAGADGGAAWKTYVEQKQRAWENYAARVEPQEFALESVSNSVRC